MQIMHGLSVMTVCETQALRGGKNTVTFHDKKGMLTKGLNGDPHETC